MASSAAVNSTAASTGCCSGHASLVTGATGLPNNSRTAATTTLIGFHAATHCNGLGRLCIGTNAVLRNVSGNTSTKATPMTASGVRTARPIHVPTQIIADENSSSNN